MNRFTLGVAAAALAAAGAAYAIEASDMPGSGRDPDGDGVVTRAEAQTRAGAMFDRMDANRDGKLDEADRAAHEAQMFDRMDTDHNGQLSRDEFTAARAGGPNGEHGPPPMAMGGPPPGPAEAGGPGMAGPGMGPGMPGKGPHHGGFMIRGPMADTDGDGSTSRAEFVAAGLKHFDEADTNHDGKLSATERQAARGPMVMEMRKRWQARGDAAPPPPPAPPPTQ